MAFLRRFWTSLTGVRNYQSLVAAGFGRAFGHICLLIVILAIAYGIRDFGKARDVLDFLAQEVVKWPDFRLQDGRFQFAGQMPFVSVQENMAFIIDTEGEGGRAIFDQYPEAILLTETTGLLQEPDTKTTPINWSDLPFEASRDGLARSMPGWVWPITALIVLGLLLGNLIAKGFSALLLGLVGLAAGGGRVSYGQTYQVSLYALTGPILLSLAKNLLYPKLPFFFLLYWGWALAYVILAVLAMKKDLANAPGVPAAPMDEEKVPLI